MRTEQKEIMIRDLVAGYSNSIELGVFAYNGKLNVRPAFQREYVYKDKQRDAVIETVLEGSSLNEMNWGLNDNGTWEVIDGQQRTISICSYVNSDFSYKGLKFGSLPKDIQEKFLDYKVRIQICDGTPSERLRHFQKINIAGEPLNDQELRNAVYVGEWLSNAKLRFSRTNGKGVDLVSEHSNGVSLRQTILEQVIKWHMYKTKHKTIEDYMSHYQHTENSDELYLYIEKVIEWVEDNFTNYRKLMKQVDWGYLYATYSKQTFNATDLENKLSTLLIDDEITNKKGAYEYVLSNDERHLGLRAFDGKQKIKAYELSKGICTHCGNHFKENEMEADHITPWSKGGKTELDNCQMLCMKCNRTKSAK